MQTLNLVPSDNHLFVTGTFANYLSNVRVHYIHRVDIKEMAKIVSRYIGHIGISTFTDLIRAKCPILGTPSFGD